MTFNDYRHFDSLEAPAAAAKAKSQDSNAQMRNKLFFPARASGHADSDAYLTQYAEMLPYFRKLIGD